MIFLAPFALLGLAALPAIYVLLRFTPPAARRVRFPPLALLRDLGTADQTPRHLPLWLLLLRLGAAALIITGLAGPSLHPAIPLAGVGPVLLVIDNGWSTAATWPVRRAAAARIIAAAQQANRAIAMLATAAGSTTALPPPAPMPAPQAGQMLDALQPQPWPSDRPAATAALQNATETTRIYIADGITDGPGFPAFMKQLAPTRILSNPAPPLLLQSVRTAADGRMIIHALNLAPTNGVSIRTAAGAILAHASSFPAGDATVTLPPALTNQASAVILDGPATAAGIYLLDSSAHTVLVGLAAGAGNAEAPFLGALYYLRRALPGAARILTGDLATLINAKAGLIILADVPLTSNDQALARRYIAAGGILLRFSGPLTAALPDDLSPDPLLAGDRRLGGVLTWGTPQSLKPFPPTSPFAGLPPPATAIVFRQVLADPTRLDAATVWTTLQDSTPLVIGASLGKGTLVSVLTSANADWSNLALSGAYPAMLQRLVGLAAGTAPNPRLRLVLSAQLTAYGALAPPTATATLTAGNTTAEISPAQPPGLYSAGGTTVALNLGGHIPPSAAAAFPDAEPLTGALPPHALGPELVATAILLLAADLLVASYRRGLLTFRRLAILSALLISFTQAHAQLSTVPAAALQTSLGYIRTGDAATDQLSGDGLGYLSADVSLHTSASLGNPIALNPATDDLALYPLIYWPILATTPPPGAATCAALNDYTKHGGLLVIDTAGGDAGAPGSGAGFAPGAGAALARATACLSLPPLQPLTGADALAHCFYILHDFPGRFTGAPVLIAAAASRDADGVSPVIIGQNGWAAAWARDATGTVEQLPLPGGGDQRLLADRFGTNLVIYALTGDYKSDQSNILALLNKLAP